jgi:hypothetical protein
MAKVIVVGVNDYGYFHYVANDGLEMIQPGILDYLNRDINLGMARRKINEEGYQLKFKKSDTEKLLSRGMLESELAQGVAL